MKKSTSDILVAVSLITLAVCLRLLPHGANFAPVAAVALFGGAVLPQRLALLVPVAAMMVSDIVLGLHPLIPLTWGCYALTALAANHWLKNGSIAKGGFLTLSASSLFFVVTNFGVWATSGMYVHSWSGVIRCYEMALPFFRNTFLSDVLYTAGLFAAYALATRLSRKLQPAYA